MDSAQLIAVKEVELDMDSQEKAKAVSAFQFPVPLLCTVFHFIHSIYLNKIISNLRSCRLKLAYCVVYTTRISCSILAPQWTNPECIYSWSTYLVDQYTVY